jgi:hypothetical protein
MANRAYICTGAAEFPAPAYPHPSWFYPAGCQGICRSASTELSLTSKPRTKLSWSRSSLSSSVSVSSSESSITAGSAETSVFSSCVVRSVSGPAIYWSVGAAVDAVAVRVFSLVVVLFGHATLAVLVMERRWAGAVFRRNGEDEDGYAVLVRLAAFCCRFQHRGTRERGEAVLVRMEVVGVPLAAELVVPSCQGGCWTVWAATDLAASSSAGMWPPTMRDGWWGRRLRRLLILRDVGYVDRRRAGQRERGSCGGKLVRRRAGVEVVGALELGAESWRQRERSSHVAAMSRDTMEERKRGAVLPRLTMMRSSNDMFRRSIAHSLPTPDEPTALSWGLVLPMLTMLRSQANEMGSYNVSTAAAFQYTWAK